LAALTLVVVPIANALVDIIPRTRFPSIDMMRIEVKTTLLASRYGELEDTIALIGVE
jgi:hypothetical protein